MCGKVMQDSIINILLNSMFFLVLPFGYPLCSQLKGSGLVGVFVCTEISCVVQCCHIARQVEKI
jgi:hypothetical protein